MARHMLTLVLITALFSLVNGSPKATATVEPPASSDPDEHGGNGMPLWVRPRDRQLLGLTVGGMPVDTVVANDGNGNHTTVSAAVAGAPRKSRNNKYVIYIRRGTYTENVEILKTNIMLVGDGIGQTIISGSRSNKTGYSTVCSATVSVTGNDFMARDLTIENTAGPDGKQAVALLSRSKRSVFYRCELKGYQDTLFAASNVQFYRDCEISGTVDFVTGNAKAVFQNCLLLARRPKRGGDNVVTAQGRDGPDHASGFSFQNCSVTTREDLSGVDTYLGRPWKNHSHVVFMQSFLDKIVHPSGWVSWNKKEVVEQTTRTVLYGEYRNTGPRANVSGRVKWPGFHVIEDAGEAAKYTVGQFINGSRWLPATGVKYNLGL